MKDSHPASNSSREKRQEKEWERRWERRWLLRVDGAGPAAAGGASAPAALAAPALAADSSAFGPAPVAFASAEGGDVGVTSASDDPAAVEADGQRTHLQVQVQASAHFAVETAVCLDQDRILEVEGGRVTEGGHVLLSLEVAYPGRREDLDLEEDLGRGDNLAGAHILGEDGRPARVWQDCDYGEDLAHGVEAAVLAEERGAFVPELERGGSRGRGVKRELGVRQGLQGP